METAGGQGRATVPTTEILEGLNDLLQLDHDAIGAYQVAIEKLDDRDHAAQVQGFLRDHERHVRELNELIQELGGVPVNEPHVTGPFKQALQSLGGLAGDRGTLMAFRTNELQVRTKYDHYASQAVFWPDRVKAAVDRAALDEERHYRWVSEVLDRAGEGEGNETVARVREGASRMADAARDRAEGIASAARDRASGAAASARAGAADGLAAAADRLGAVAEEQGQAGGARGRAAGAAQAAAGGLDAAADFVRSPDMERLRAGVEEQVRTSPLRAIIATFAAGFIIGRILR